MHEEEYKSKDDIDKSGENEQKNESVSVRQRDAKFGKQELGEMRLEGFIELLKKSERE